ncbi:TonB-dependent receptor [Ramlibacter sp. RBP-2]|uniref:TonB-dependent receptor n=1 Tax=Ramlibacter lithotrophicus TaxID=2606681 RepID=A0A7X6I5N5_9BURK|nr:TonB-dependent receptor [Ramlibacter lithotrophicus]NKE65259.1 TonB-dependent receptor [Ramlibacter lithotrophicus]
MSTNFVRAAIGAAAVAACGGSALAQSALPPVTITGNPLGGSDLVAPAAQLSGTGLTVRSQSTLGETLNQLPGVSSTYFGPNASRPVIRGLDGDRIRILSNGGTALDVSNLSYDHAVAADPLAMERIEVLRGPAALLYGGNAIGGVVNVIDNRIPRQPGEGVLGKADLGYATGGREKNAAAMVETGNSRLGLHVDAFRRRHGDVRVPAALGCTQGGVNRVEARICNSGSEADGGAVGGSLFFDRGYLGASATTYDSSYGAVAEDEVTIGMRSNRYSLEGELRPGGLVQSVKARAGHADYRHTEYEAAEAGTVFRNRGNDLRLEARHAKLGSLEGVLGLQVESARFSADGTEAFAPYSRTRQRALFLYEELATGWGKFTFGGRAEHVQVASEGSPLVARFAPASRSFNPGSASVGVLWNVAPRWQVTGNLAHSQRAPKDYELYADGPHVATGAYEVGSADLGKERSTHAEAGVQWKDGASSLRVNAFSSRFANYIALLGTGRLRDADGGGAGGTGAADCGDGTSLESGCSAEVMPEMAYQGVRATFRGVEASGTMRAWDAAGHTVDVELRGDLVRAMNRSIGQPLPRIAPVRVGATGTWSRGPWSARLGFDHHAAQSRVPAGDRPTGSYTLWQASAQYRMQLQRASLLWYARLDNATDRLAYSATSILTQSAPGRVPLPGRSLKVGLQASF